jgi:hypothetical protein
VAGVCAELAIQWRQNPRLSSGKPVPFDEYLAARLYSRLRELEQQEYPDLYDAHRVYQPDWEPLPLRADAAGAETGELARTPAPRPIPRTTNRSAPSRNPAGRSGSSRR